MKKVPNYELLRDAYMIIDGIPDEIFNLDNVYSNWRNASATCGTVACAAGWLALHPDFNKLGFKYDAQELEICMQGVPIDAPFDKKIGKLFNMRGNAAYQLFASRTESSYDRKILAAKGENVTDKELWKERIITFLKTDPNLVAA